MLNLTGYSITEKIYEDEKTIVYRGIRLKDSLPVIIKQLNNEHPSPSDILKFKHEYEINRMLNSDYIIKIYDLIEVKNLPLLIMEDFNGSSLRLVISSGKITIYEFLKIAVKISAALSELHNSNIVHNDVNPGNIIVNLNTGAVKITDLGISAVLSKDNKNIQNYKKVEGTLSYISPEQTGRMNRAVDNRTDFYSLGITFYQMLVGSLPFYAEDELGLIYCHLAKQPVSPYQIDNTIPRVLSDIVMKLLEKMAENRYQSAKGLKNDLEECLRRLEENHSIDFFQVGSNDISSRFSIPQKLYGRDYEINSLLSSLEYVNHGEMQIVTVSGYSGIGKSSLVNELHKFVVNRRGFFSTGKFDQLNHDTSYSALIQSIEGILDQILSQSKEKIQEWKNNILECLGFNGKVIIDVIPSLELVIGSQPEVPVLPPVEAQNRFNLVFKNFIKCFCSQEHPLVIFLDDMQWCDLATLRLLETLITDGDSKYFLLILAFRDNEVFGAHPLALTLDNINKSGIKVKPIGVKPLQLSDIVLLLKETFQKCCINDKEKFRINSLAELCLNKTEGNPFFLNQFLQMLYQEKLIWFDIESGSWDFDVDNIRNTDITDNVVELMIRKIQKLPREVQALLTFSACIGNKFDLKNLSFLSKKSTDEAYSILVQALYEGLILIDSNPNIGIDYNKGDLRFRFLHDRIQQAAYGLIDNANRKHIHLEFGRLMLSSTDKNGCIEKVFDILNHYNLGIEFVVDKNERELLAELELIAGRKAKKAIAYDLSYKYLKAGIDLLNEDCWDKLYGLSLSLHTEAAEAAYLNGNFNSMVNIIDIVSKRTLTILDRVDLYKIRIQACVAQGKISEAVDFGIEIIELLGISMPRHPNKLQILLRLVKLRLSLKNRNIEGFTNLPELKNKNYAAVLSIISIIGAISYRTDPVFMSMILIEAIKLLTKHGNTPDAPFLYAGYGLVACALGDIETGYLFGKLALKLVDELDVTEQKSRVIFMNNAFIAHWKEAYKDLLPAFKEGYKSGLDVGDLEFASYNGFYYCNKSFYAGKNLEKLEEEMIYFIEGIKNIHQTPQLHLLKMMAQIVQNLRGKNTDPTLLCGDIYDENVMMEIHYETKDNTAVSSVYILKLILCYLFEDYTDAELNADLTEEYIDNLQSTVAIPTYYYYSSLTKLALYNHSSEIKQREILKAVKAGLKKMKKWAAHGQMNYEHRLYLLEAEKARVLNKYNLADEYYNRAIKFAGENRFIQDEALANELALKYNLQRGNKKLARLYLEDAKYCYMRWGADEKVKYLDIKYTQLLYTKLEAINFSNSEGITSISLNQNTGALAAFDSAAILKATQAMSGEIKLEELLKKLVNILLENSGAQRVVYLMKKDQEFVIAAEGSSIDNRIEVFQNYYIGEYERLPKKIFHYVNHSKQNIILNNPLENGNYMDDPYFLRNHPRSLLCMPVLTQMEISGILYLENNLIEGAFSSDRIEILKIISSQLAISMDNAKMYMDLELLNNSLEQKVAERTDELSQTLKRISNQEMALKQLLGKVYTLLDNSGEGFLSFNKDFIIDSEYSRECKIIFSRDISKENVLKLLFGDNEDRIKSFSKSISMIFETDDNYKKEVLISLLPSVININSKFIRIKYKMLENYKVMLILTDITREKELEEQIKAEQDRLKLIVSSFINKDELIGIISSYKDFIKGGLMEILADNFSDEEKLSEIYRNIHTYKGIFSQFSFIYTPRALNRLENELSEFRKNISELQKNICLMFKNNNCSEVIDEDLNIISEILGENFLKDKTKISISEDDLIKLKKAADLITPGNLNWQESISDIRIHTPAPLLNEIHEAVSIIKTLHYRELTEMLEPYQAYVQKLAERLGKNISSFKIEGPHIKVDPNKYSSFIKSLIHVFRNAVDHGIENPDERIEAGKDEKGMVKCSVNLVDNKLIFSISDDGQGIDTEHIKKKAIEKGIIAAHKANKLDDSEVLLLMFSDSFTTKDSASDISGRGYGLSAVMNELKKLDGSVKVETSIGKGSEFVFILPY